MDHVMCHPIRGLLVVLLDSLLLLSDPSPIPVSSSLVTRITTADVNNIPFLHPSILDFHQPCFNLELVRLFWQY
jgi:hypothetical protein